MSCLADDRNNPQHSLQGKEIRNIVVLTVSFQVVFTAFNALQNLHSSVHDEQRLGLISLAVLYFTSALSSVVSPTVIGLLGARTVLAVFFLFHCVYVASNFHPSFATMLPAAALVGLLFGPAWTSQGLYIAANADSYCKGRQTSPFVILDRFNWFFFTGLASSQVLGNLVTSIVLQHGGVNTTGDDVISSCGVLDCHTNENYTKLEDPHGKPLTVILSVYLACTAVGVVLVISLLPPLPRRDWLRTVSARESVVSCCRTLFRPDVLLLVPFIVYTAIQNAFLIGTYTVSYVSCPLGLSMVGYVMAAYGTATPALSFFFGLLAKLVGRFLCLTLAMGAHIVLLVVLYHWAPDESDVVSLFVVPVVWGVSECVVITQANSLIANLNDARQDQTFAHFHTWRSIGYCLTFLCSTYLCVSTTIMLTLACAVLAVVLYVVLEFKSEFTHVWYQLHYPNLYMSGMNSIIPVYTCLVSTPLSQFTHAWYQLHYPSLHMSGINSIIPVYTCLVSTPLSLHMSGMNSIIPVYPCLVSTPLSQFTHVWYQLHYPSLSMSGMNSIIAVYTCLVLTPLSQFTHVWYQLHYPSLHMSGINSIIPVYPCLVSTPLSQFTHVWYELHYPSLPMSGMNSIIPVYPCLIRQRVGCQHKEDGLSQSSSAADVNALDRQISDASTVSSPLMSPQERVVFDHPELNDVIKEAQLNWHRDPSGPTLDVKRAMSHASTCTAARRCVLYQCRLLASVGDSSGIPRSFSDSHVKSLPARQGYTSADPTRCPSVNDSATDDIDAQRETSVDEDMVKDANEIDYVNRKRIFHIESDSDSTDTVSNGKGKKWNGTKLKRGEVSHPLNQDEAYKVLNFELVVASPKLGESDTVPDLVVCCSPEGVNLKNGSSNYRNGNTVSPQHMEFQAHKNEPLNHRSVRDDQTTTVAPENHRSVREDKITTVAPEGSPPASPTALKLGQSPTRRSRGSFRSIASVISGSLRLSKRAHRLSRTSSQRSSKRSHSDRSSWDTDSNGFVPEDGDSVAGEFLPKRSKSSKSMKTEEDRISIY
ncbi:Protein unc-93 A [Bulinus truncatus]|nr:Protein unc-93 A [Bulinus truncatus]